MSTEHNNAADIQREDDSCDARPFSASRAPAYAMTGDVGPTIRDATHPIPFLASDEPIPYRLADGFVWAEEP